VLVFLLYIIFLLYIFCFIPGATGVLHSWKDLLKFILIFKLVTYVLVVGTVTASAKDLEMLP
jgi:hypothetical protein